MSLLKVFFWTTLAALMIIFTLQNRVIVDFQFFYFQFSLPLFILILGCLFVGAFATFLWMGLIEIGLKYRIKRLETQVKKQEEKSHGTS